MARLLVVGVLVAMATHADADPQVRFGMTFGVDGNIPEAHQFGPMIALGTGTGRFTGEVNYSYLAMFDDYSLHRAGVGLRMDILRSWHANYSSKAWYAEAGAAKRWGHWSVIDTMAPETKSQGELQLATGYELSGNGGAWQIALRFGFARRDPQLGTACRGMTCPLAMPASTGVAQSVMLEWTWLLGRGY